jgi:preprotein translocase subunit SecD
MFKNNSSKVLVITILATLALLISLPRIDIKYDTKYFNIDSYLGGYIINIPFTTKFVDFSDFKKGLDIEGGVKVVIKLDMSQIRSEDQQKSAESVRDILNRRINYLGVSETSTYISKANNEYRIIVEIPGQKNLEAAIKSIGSTAQLKFKVVKPGLNWPITDPNLTINEVFVDSNITGKDLIGSEVSFESTKNQPVIQLSFSNEGREKFSSLVRQNVKKPIGIFLDDTLLQAPIVSEELANGLTSDPTITGVDLETAKNISSLLRAGALPVPIEIVQQSFIGATLGQESVNKSLIAGFIGLFIIFIFLNITYKNLGFVASISLLIYVVFVLATFKLLNVVISLPGIAGFVFSIGVACDACILIFERIKEESRWGKPSAIAIMNGYDRAWSSIKDSNFSTLLASFILFQFGSGFVKGFALTLAIGIFFSLICCVYISKILVSTFIKEVKFK